MAVRQRKDGRWTCYYRVEGPDGKKSKQKEEFFGRGPDGEAAAWQRNEELGLGRRRKKEDGPSFRELARTYYQKKIFSDNSRKHLDIRLEANILPFFGNKLAK